MSHISSKNSTVQDFINIYGVSKDFLYTTDRYIFGYIYVRTDDNKLFSDEEKEFNTDKLTSALSNDKKPFQIISLPKTMDIKSMVNKLTELRNNVKSDARLRLIDQELETITELTEDNRAKENIIFIKLWETYSQSAEETLRNRIDNILKKLSEYKIKCTMMHKKDIIYICNLFANLDIHNDIEEGDYINENKNLFKKKGKKEPKNAALLNLVSPTSFDFLVNKTIIGSAIGKCYGAIRYPAKLSYGWLSRIMNTTNAVTCITYEPKPANELADSLSKSVKQSVSTAISTKDTRERKRAERSADDAEDMISQIDRDGEPIGLCSIVIMPFGFDDESLDNAVDNILNITMGLKIKLKCFGNLQKEAFKSISPYYPFQEKIGDITNWVMPLRTIMGGDPTALMCFKDDNGSYFGTMENGSAILLDLWARGGDRTNSNIVIMGNPGTGKSTCIKHIMQIMRMQGVKCLVIDPESEYKEMCLKLDGAWLNTGGGKAKINVLQVRPAPNDAENENGEKLYDKLDEGTNDLSLHLKSLEVFFELYLPSLTGIQKALLKKSLVEVYKKFGITWDTDIKSLKNTDFPIISDLYALLNEKAEKDEAYKELSALFYDIAEGADSFLWNGYTNIETDNDFICFDTFALQNASDGIKRAQYFNILMLCWEIMSSNRNQPVMLFCDEAYLMIDKTVPQTLLYLRNISKRCRKFGGGLAIISHYVVDFLDPSIKMYGQALLDSPTYKFFFGTDGKNLQETIELFGMTKSEQKLLASKAQRKAICQIGSYRIYVHFLLPQSKLDLMGSGGGR